MKYRFLLFDADYTLLDFPADMTSAFQHTYTALFASQLPYSPRLLELYNSCNNRAWSRFEQGICTKQELYITRFVEFLEQSGLSGDPHTVNETYFTALAQTGTPYPGAQDLLARLCKDFELYMITNGNVVSQGPRFQHAGIAPFFRDVFVSEAVGVGKPHKAYFDYVAAHIPGFAPAQAIVIGDSLASDIQGAKNAGLDSIWFCPSGTGASDSLAGKDAAFTYRAESYEDIVRILYEL